MAKKRPTIEERIQREWQDPEIRAEFLDDFEGFTAFMHAEENGLIKYQITEKFDLKKHTEILQLPTYRDSKLVREMVGSMHSRTAAKSKRGVEGPLKQTIRIIMQQTGATSIAELIEKFEDEDAMDNFFYSRSNPTPIQVISVDHTAETIAYKTRSGQEKTVSFSRFGSAISEIKKT